MCHPPIRPQNALTVSEAADRGSRLRICSTLHGHARQQSCDSDKRPWSRSFLVNIGFELLCRPLVSLKFTKRPRHVASDSSMAGSGIGRASYYAAACALCSNTPTIQHRPNLSVTMPKRGEKNVLPSGICTWPPLARASNNRLASASLAAEMVSEKFLNPAPSCEQPSEAITWVSPMRTLACIILSPQFAGTLSAGGGSGLSL